MSIEELQAEIQSLKQKLQQTQSDFESYKSSSKQFQQLIEEESNKKQQEIKKLSNQSILKDKTIKQSKNDLTKLQTQINAQKEQLDKYVKTQSNADSVKQSIEKFQKQIEKLKKENQELIKSIEKYKAEVTSTEKSKQQQLQVLTSKIDKIANELKQSLLQQQSLKCEIESLKMKSNKKQQSLELSGKKKEINISKDIFEKQRQKYEERIKKLEQSQYKFEKIVKQSKSKLQSVLEQNEMLRNKLSSSNLNFNNSIVASSPMLVKNINEDDEQIDRPRYYCLLITKPHYISPFLEIYEDKNLIKIYKSSRSGCFQKSMGCYKHKFDAISFQHEQIITNISDKIMNGETNEHAIVFFGSRRSDKKILMSKLILSVKQFLVSKLQQEAKVQAVFIQKSAEQQKNIIIKAEDKQSTIQLINKAISIGNKEEKTKQKFSSPKKGQQNKPKVRFFKIIIGDFILQIGTSSYTSLSFRQKNSPSNMLNNILYSKLPDTLQSSYCQKTIVLTLNPIVELYEDCKNTLSVTMCRGDNILREENEKQWKSSPLRQEHLNDMAKKRIENVEKQNQQTSLRMKRLEQQCHYYKSRFDQLEIWLKNLLNTHSGQNSYLKKSPITLSYEKLLKFVHGVQGRNLIGQNPSQSMYFKNNTILQKDNESIDAL